MIEIAKAPLNISFTEAMLNCTILKGGRAEGMVPVSFTPFLSRANIMIKKIGTVIPSNGTR